jgi:uncharacterized repeat protein (TIGR01451 family)
MKKCRVISLFDVVKLCVVWCALLGSYATASFQMTFEEFLGHNGVEIGTFYPGVQFEAIGIGQDWIAYDITSGSCNASSWPSGQSWNSGNYWVYDLVGAWTGAAGDSGKISFDQRVGYVEVGYCCKSQLHVTAYDAQDNPIDSATGPANLRYLNNNESGPGRICVGAPLGNNIKYIIIHDTVNSWVVDNIFVGTDMILTKEDDVNDDPNYPTCVTPGTDITYTICYENISDAAFEDVYIIDRLPAGVDYDYIISENPLVVDPDYNIAEHTYRWDLGTVASEASGCVELLVTVNAFGEPLSFLHNVAEVWGTTYDANDLPVDTLRTTATEDTPVCCWGGDIIYVDQDAPGPHTGTSWATAYSNLQDALARAAAGCGNEIRIADGTYNPGDSYLSPPGMYTDTFEIPAGVSVYGGYAGYSDPSATRNSIKYKTILSGYIGATARNSIVVTMGNGCLLDGCVVEKAAWRSITGTSVDFSVHNCTIKDSALTGIYCENGNLDVQWCDIKDNGQEGIYHLVSETGGYTLSVETCKISGNQWDGIVVDSSTPQIKNSFICQNGLASTPSPYYRYYGINILNPSSSPIIRNNTIAHNKIEGIKFVGSTNAPDIRNCIIWYNNGNDPNQLSGYETTHFSCVKDPNEETTIPDGYGNINANPNFVYSAPGDPNDYHITVDSPCIDKGDDNPNPAIGVDEKDIDNKDRVYDWVAATANDVDMGADEFSKDTDWNSDGIVNLVEFAIFSAAWLSNDQSGNWDDRCDLDYPNPNGVIDLDDLALFAHDWLWTDPWHSSEETWMMMASGGGDSSEVSSAATATESLATVEAETALTPELTLEERIAQLTEILGWLEDEVSQDEDTQKTITEEQMQAFIDDVIKILDNLKTDYDNN